MNKSNHRRFFSLSVALSALAIFVSANTFASLVEWVFPRTASCHEGLAFSDGRTGVLVWGGGDEILLTVGRGDLWDHRGGYPWTDEQSYSNIVSAVQNDDSNRLLSLFKKTTPKGEPRNPYMLPLGRVVVKVLGKTLSRGTLDTDTGLGVLEFVDGSKAEIAMAKTLGGVFAMRFSKDVSFSAKSIPCTDFDVYEKELRPIGFEKAQTHDRADIGGFTWNLPADKPVWLSWQKTGATFVLRTGRDAPAAVARDADFEIVESDSKARWGRFWREGARVKVPDPVIQRIFDYGMYRFGAMTDPDGFAAGLQGQWLEDNALVPWNGDYHFNINVQECYSPAYRGGHFAHLMPLFKMVLSWRALLRDNAKKFVGIDDGYVLPHSVDDRGVCIGGFWTGTIDHASTAWIASMMMKYVRYSRDIGFLKSGAYDFMKGAMRVYRKMMEEYKGRLSIPVAPSPEWAGASVKGAVGRDSSFQLAAAHRLARDLVEAAEMLGEKADPVWLDVIARLPVFTAHSNEIELFEGQKLTESHRHHSHMAGFYPFDVIDMKDPAAYKVAAATYWRWVNNGTGKWTGWCVPWAAILNIHVGNAQAAASLLHNWEAYFCNPGHGSLHNSYEPGFTVYTINGSFAGSGDNQVMQMDGQCAAATAVMEMMAHEVNGKVEFFKGCPQSWKDVSFENIRLADGTKVSGRRLNGKITITRENLSRKKSSGVSVKPASPFKDGMVLQRGRKVPVWGKAPAGAEVTVEFAGQKLSTRADSKGAWRVELAAMKASKVSRTMKINDLEIKDVLVGEVWLASGQSNMALPIWNSDPRVRDRNGAAVMQIVRHRNVRYANLLDWKTSATPQDDIDFKWREHRQSDVSRAWNGGQSAVAFYFAEQLYQALDVPIGMIVACAGGTPIKPFFVGQPVFNHYFSPVAPYAARGLIWYQGESDGARTSEEYVGKLRTFLDGWGKAFENPSLPMYIAQICSAGNVALAQGLFAKEDPRAHLAVTVDVGNPWDIHPNEKYTVGLRLAMLALKNEYGWKDIKAESPTFKAARREPGGKVRLSFDNAHSFYSYAMDLSAQTSFQLADKRRVWHPARLENLLNVSTNKEGRVVTPGLVRGTQLVLSSESVPEPCFVRYTGDPRFASLYNEAALPLAPFVSELKGPVVAAKADDSASLKGDFLAHLRIIERGSCKGRIAQLAQVPPVAEPTAAELSDPQFRRIVLAPPDGRRLEEGEVNVMLGDIVTRIQAEGLKGIILDASGTDDRELPALYFAAYWIGLHQNDIWDF